MLTYSYISERDIDLVLIEELNCSSNFRKWFLNIIKKTKGIKHFSSNKNIDIFHSTGRKDSVTGETDIEINITDNSGVKLILLLENKIDASFQKNQPQRYKSEVKRILKDGDADFCYSILLAPKEYFIANSEAEIFDILISYEEIIKYFKSRFKNLSTSNEELSNRYEHKLEIFNQAIEKQRRGYSPEIDPNVTAFWSAYYEYSKEKAPSLKMSQPGPKPSQSDFISFNNAIERIHPLPQCKIKHKLPHGLVDLEIDGWGKHVNELSPQLISHLDIDMRIRKASKSLSISIDVHPIAASAPFEDQIDLVAVGLNAAIRFQEWYRSKKEILLNCYNSLQ